MNFVQRNASSSPLIYKLGHKIRVRNLTVEKQGNHWSVSDTADEITTFSYRSWAIAYATALVMNNDQIAIYLQDAEKRLSRLLLDKELYVHHLESAEKRQDHIKSEILEHRMGHTDREIYELMSTVQQAVLYQRF